MSEQVFYGIMLLSGNTYQVCGSTFTAGVPRLVSADVYDYIKRKHYLKFRFWTQDTPSLSPSFLEEQGIVVTAPVAAKLEEAVSAPKEDFTAIQKRAAARKEHRAAVGLDEPGIDEPEGVSPDDVANAFGNPDDKPEEAVEVAAEEIKKARQGRGRKSRS